MEAEEQLETAEKEDLELFNGFVGGTINLPKMVATRTFLIIEGCTML